MAAEWLLHFRVRGVLIERGYIRGSVDNLEDHLGRLFMLINSENYDSCSVKIINVYLRCGIQ